MKINLLLFFSIYLVEGVAQPYTQNLSGTIYSGSPVYTGAIINSNQQLTGDYTNVSYLAGLHVHLTDGFQSPKLYLTGTPLLHAKIKDVIVVSDMSGTAFNPAQWRPWELGISLPNTPDNINAAITHFLNNGGATSNTNINPYDPDEIKIEMDFVAPSGKIYTRYGFYFVDFAQASFTVNGQNNCCVDYSPNFPTIQQYPFRIRFSPPEVGNYTCTLKIYLNNILQTNSSYQFAGSFTCSSNSGFLTPLSLGGQNNMHLQDANGNMVFAMGRNVAFAGDAYSLAGPADFILQRSYLQKIANAGGNWARVRIDPWSNDFEWEELGVYGSNTAAGNNYQSQYQARELDATLSQCENTGMYMYLELLENQGFDVGGSNPFNWSVNPYHNDISTVNNPQDFLTDATALQYFKRKLFYIMARWGYSPNIGVMSIMNETDQFPNYDHNYTNAGAMNFWLLTIGDYLKNGDANTVFYPQHILTSDYGTLPQAPDDGRGGASFDMFTSHNYSGSRNSIGERHDYVQEAAPSGDSNPVNANPNLPYIWGELGNNCSSNQPEYCTDAEVHNAIWGTSMNSNAIGCGMYWWDWEDRNAIAHENNFTALNAFFMGGFGGVGNSTPIVNTFKDQSYTSEWDCDVAISFGTYPNSRKIEWVFNQNSTGNQGYGWVHNSDYFWLNISLDNPCPSNPLYPLGICTDNSPNNAPTSPGTSPPHNNVLVTLTGYDIHTKFLVEQWSCYGNGGLLSTSEVTSGFFGDIKFDVNVGGFAGDAMDPDYAYKIYEESTVFFKTEPNTNIPPDTIYLNAYNPCIHVHGGKNSITKGTHKWNFGNGITSNEENPLVCYPSQGTYTVNHSYVDTAGNNININGNVTIVYKDTSSVIKANPDLINTNSNIIIYPNPFTSGVTVQAQKSISKIVVRNTLGIEVGKFSTIENNNFSFNISPNNAPGVYFVTLEFTDGQLITKAITKQ